MAAERWFAADCAPGVNNSGVNTNRFFTHCRGRMTVTQALAMLAEATVTAWTILSHRRDHDYARYRRSDLAFVPCYEKIQVIGETQLRSWSFQLLRGERI